MGAARGSAASMSSMVAAAGMCGVSVDSESGASVGIYGEASSAGLSNVVSPSAAVLLGVVSASSTVLLGVVSASKGRLATVAEAVARSIAGVVKLEGAVGLERRGAELGNFGMVGYGCP